ncbi:MAG: 30S ribosomal protein S17 [Candidatus Aminicenantes bacterium]
MDTIGQKRKTTKVGTVIARKMSKTVTVQVVRQIRHPLYKKIVRKKQTFLVHDETEKCKIGDVVRIIETRPISKLKRWRVLEIVGMKPALTASELAEVVETAEAGEPVESAEVVETAENVEAAEAGEPVEVSEPADGEPR